MHESSFHVGTVVCHCSKCGSKFIMGSAAWVRASEKERITCKECLKKEGEEKHDR